MQISCIEVDQIPVAYRLPERRVPRHVKTWVEKSAPAWPLPRMSAFRPHLENALEENRINLPTKSARTSCPNREMGTDIRSHGA